MVDGIQKHFERTWLRLMGNRGPGCRTLYRFCRTGRPAIQRAFHAVCGDRLASGLRALGPRLRDGGGPIGAGYGFGTLALPEVVSFTSATNRRSRAVMERLGMRRDPVTISTIPRCRKVIRSDRHVLYRLGPD